MNIVPVTPPPQIVFTYFVTISFLGLTEFRADAGRGSGRDTGAAGRVAGGAAGLEFVHLEEVVDLGAERYTLQVVGLVIPDRNKEAICMGAIWER